MPSYVLEGFDRWCRVSCGLSNEKIAQAISVNGRRYSPALVKRWREGAGVPDPDVVLRPIQIALEGPWPPAVAELAWQELQKIIAKGMANPPCPDEPEPPPEAPALKAEPARKAAPKKKAAPAAPVDPALEAIKQDLDQGTDRLAPLVQAAEQLSAGWFSRAAERYKKYQPQRDFKHRKAFLNFCLAKAEKSLERMRSRRADLKAGLDQLGSAVQAFNQMQQETAERMERRRDDYVGLWRELKASAPLISSAQQALEKGTGKTLAGLDDAIRRGEALVAEWTSRCEEMKGEEGVTLSWLTPGSKLGQRLKQVWQEKGGPKGWPEGFDPFEGACVCKDKLADGYRPEPSHGRDRPVEIDLAAEIDLSIASLEQRRQVAHTVATS